MQSQRDTENFSVNMHFHRFHFSQLIFLHQPLLHVYLKSKWMYARLYGPISQQVFFLFRQNTCWPWLHWGQKSNMFKSLEYKSGAALLPRCECGWKLWNVKCKSFCTLLTSPAVRAIWNDLNDDVRTTAVEGCCLFIWTTAKLKMLVMLHPVLGVVIVHVEEYGVKFLFIFYCQRGCVAPDKLFTRGHFSPQ